MQYFAYLKILIFYIVEREKQALFLFQNGGDAYDCIKVKTQNKFICHTAGRNDFTMKKFGNTIIIGIDHGFGNVKTERHIFPSGVVCYDE